MKYSALTCITISITILTHHCIGMEQPLPRKILELCCTYADEININNKTLTLTFDTQKLDIPQEKVESFLYKIACAKSYFSDKQQEKLLSNLLEKHKTFPIIATFDRHINATQIDPYGLYILVSLLDISTEKSNFVLYSLSENKIITHIKDTYCKASFGPLPHTIIFTDGDKELQCVLYNILTQKNEVLSLSYAAEMLLPSYTRRYILQHCNKLDGQELFIKDTITNKTTAFRRILGDVPTFYNMLNLTLDDCYIFTADNKKWSLQSLINETDFILGKSDLYNECQSIYLSPNFHIVRKNDEYYMHNFASNTYKQAELNIIPMKNPEFYYDYDTDKLIVFDMDAPHALCTREINAGSEDIIQVIQLNSTTCLILTQSTLYTYNPFEKGIKLKSLIYNSPSSVYCTPLSTYTFVGAVYNPLNRSIYLDLITDEDNNEPNKSMLVEYCLEECTDNTLQLKLHNILDVLKIADPALSKISTHDFIINEINELKKSKDFKQNSDRLVSSLNSLLEYLKI